MTKEQKASYLEEPDKCPFCKSSKIEGTGDRDYHGESEDHRIECLDCEKVWLDIYTLTGVEEVK